MTESEPKSAFEIAMERLKKKDAEEGVVERPLTEEQRAAIAEARSVCRAKVAERELLQASAIARAASPEEREAVEELLRRERRQLESDCEAKVERIRKGEEP